MTAGDLSLLILVVCLVLVWTLLTLRSQSTLHMKFCDCHQHCKSRSTDKPRALSLLKPARTRNTLANNVMHPSLATNTQATIFLLHINTKFIPSVGKYSTQLSCQLFTFTYLALRLSPDADRKGSRLPLMDLTHREIMLVQGGVVFVSVGSETSVKAPQCTLSCR